MRHAVFAAVISVLFACTGKPADPDTGGCVQIGDPGNPLKVGQYCTKYGRQCDRNGFGNAILCTADQSGDDLEEGLAFCTMPCEFNDDCGDGAICTGSTPESTLRGCFPQKCEPSNKGHVRGEFVDAGTPDAGVADAGDGGTP